MRIINGILLIMFCGAVLAQSNSQQQQMMMQKMQEMQICMQKVDQSKLEAIERRSKRLDAELKALCQNGQRDKAQAKAIAFGKEISSNPEIKQLTECAAMMQGVMPMPQTPMGGYSKEEMAARHVCDQ